MIVVINIIIYNKFYKKFNKYAQTLKFSRIQIFVTFSKKITSCPKSALLIPLKVLLIKF